MSKKPTPPLLTKNELSLLLGGLFVLFSIYYLNTETKEIKKSANEVALKADSSSIKKKENVKRTPANIEEKKITQAKKPLPLNKKQSPLMALKAAEECIHSKSCDLPNSDPRSYSLSAYRELSLAIGSYREHILKNWNPNLKKDFKRYLAYHDGFVKEEALKTILELDSDQSLDFVDDVITNVIHDHNTQLMDQTMDYIQSVSDPHLKSKVENAWIEAMLTGSPNKSEALAKYSNQMINENSLNKFKRVLDQLPLGSAERTHLESSIKEYEMTQSGG